MWGSQAGKSGYIAAVRIDGVSFEIWKASQFTEKQKDAIRIAAEKRGHTYAYNGQYRVRFTPSSASDTTYIAYIDWINPVTNLKSVWLEQMLPYIDKYIAPRPSKTGQWSHQSIEELMNTSY